MGYTLILLKSEVDNGGFYQWFTNSSGKVVYETLDDLRLIGAMQHVRVVEKAIRLNERLEGKYLSYKRRWDWRSNSPDEAKLRPEFWSDVDTNFMPEFDRLSSEIYDLEGGCGVEVVDGIERSCHITGTDPLWIHFARFVREHAEELVHHRG